MSKPNLNLYKEQQLDHFKYANDKLGLLILIYQTLIDKSIQTKKYIEANQINLKGETIKSMIEIIDLGLKPYLDMDAGGELSSNLENLYEYWVKLLIECNMTNNPALLDEFTLLVNTIKQSYEELRNG